MPTMAGAFAYDLYKSRNILSLNDGALIGVGFVMAFISGVFVVRYLLDYVSRHGFKLFGWWRLIVGSVGLAALLVWGKLCHYFRADSLQMALFCASGAHVP